MLSFPLAHVAAPGLTHWMPYHSYATDFRYVYTCTGAHNNDLQHMHDIVHSWDMPDDHYQSRISTAHTYMYMLSNLCCIMYTCSWSIISLQCHLSSVQVYAGLKRRNIGAFAAIVTISVFICLCVYTLTGVFGYLTFSVRECIASDVLRSYCPRDVMVDVARALMGVIMVTSYPILTFCGRLGVYIMHSIVPRFSLSFFNFFTRARFAHKNSHVWKSENRRGRACEWG